VPPLESQDALESQRLWRKVSQALFAQNLDEATAEKTAIEETQRQSSTHQKNYIPKWFWQQGNGEWISWFLRCKPGEQVSVNALSQKLFPGSNDDLS